MASCFFILRQFDDVLIYLSSIEAYFPSDPTFLYNYAIARAAAGKYAEAEPALLSLQSGAAAEELSKDYIFQMWLARYARREATRSFSNPRPRPAPARRRVC